MAKPEQSRSISALLWIGGLVAIAALVFSIRLLTHEDTLVRVAPVSFQTLSSTVATNGKIAVVGEFQAHAPTAGTVKKIYVEVGDQVRAGAHLVDLESADARKQVTAAQVNVASAQASLQDLLAGGSTEERGRFGSDVASAKADQQTAEAGVTAAQKLFAQGAAGAGEVAAAKQKLDASSMVLRNAQARTSGRYSSADKALAEARLADARAGVAAAQSALSGVSISSPVAGTVYSVTAAENDYVPSGEELMDVADLSNIEVIAYFDEPEIGKLAKGQAVKIVWDARPGRIWHGHVQRAPTTVMTYGTRNVGECLITVDDAKGDLLPNTNVTVTVTENQRSNVLSIPREALQTQGLTSFVYKLVDNKLVRTEVQIGILNNVNVEIIGGLTEKDTIVLGPAVPGKELSNGLTVKPVR